MKTAVAYVRSMDFEGVQAQISKIRDYAAKNQIEIRGFYSDRTGAFTEILNVKENRPDYILIARPEALSRNTFELAKLATDLAKYTQIIDVNSGESIISKISSLINSAIHDYSANLLKN